MTNTNPSHEAQRHRDACLCGSPLTHVPFGYKIWRDAEGRQRVERDLDAAGLVTAAFSRYASGRYTLPQLASALFVRGLPRQDQERRDANAVAAMLSDPFYTGLVVHDDGERCLGTHEPLVNVATFVKVQTVLAREAPPNEHA